MMTAFRLTTITLLLAVFSNSAATLYVSLGSTNPTPPYTNWATAATNIQDAIEASADGDLILVTYFGNGAGGGADSAVLIGCVLSNNLSYYGGGVENSTLYNCTLTGNLTFIDGDYTANGGGASGCTLTDCIISGNSSLTGAGASGSTLVNCTVVHNSANDTGGGVNSCTLANCIVYFNTALNRTNYSDESSLSYCDTTPLPASGFGNVTNDPAFVRLADDDFHQQANSPCINAGNNAYVTSTSDLDGNPRIVSGTVDIGAYEYQGTGSVISYAWLQQYGLPTDGSADFIDSDGDGMNNWQEWICGTCPTNAQSVLRLVSATPAGTNITVTWQSVAGVNYFLERSTNLASPFTHLASFIMGQAGTTSYADTNAGGAGQVFYRVGVLPSGAN